MNDKTVNISLNGSDILLKSDSLKELVNRLNLSEARFAVEVNTEIIPKSQIDCFALSDNDIVEIVIAVGGG